MVHLEGAGTGRCGNPSSAHIGYSRRFRCLRALPRQYRASKWQQGLRCHRMDGPAQLGTWCAAERTCRANAPDDWLLDLLCPFRIGLRGSCCGELVGTPTQWAQVASPTSSEALTRGRLSSACLRGIWHIVGSLTAVTTASIDPHQPAADTVALDASYAGHPLIVKRAASPHTG
jgi:hypothetical protein